MGCYKIDVYGLISLLSLHSFLQGEYSNEAKNKYFLKNYPEVFGAEGKTLVMRADSSGFEVVSSQEAERLRRNGMVKVITTNDPTVKPYLKYRAVVEEAKVVDVKVEDVKVEDVKVEDVKVEEANIDEGASSSVPAADAAAATVVSALMSPSIVVGEEASDRASIDFTDPGKDIFLAYIVFSLAAGVKGWADGWRPSGWGKDEV